MKRLFAVLLFAFPLSIAGADGSGAGSGGGSGGAAARPHHPPKAAFDACAKSKQGDACSFTVGSNTRQGTCELPMHGGGSGSPLVCRSPHGGHGRGRGGGGSASGSGG